MARISQLTFLLLTSLLTVSTANAQVAESTNGSATPQGGVTTTLSDCGQQGAFFERQNSCNKLNLAGRLGRSDCGGCQSTDCNSCDSAGVGSRLKEMIPMLGGNDGCGCRYFSVFGGWSDLSDISSGSGIATKPLSAFNDGFLLGVARGRYINANTRFEIENSWRNQSGSALGLTGTFNAYSTMLNTVREFGNGRIRPYAGVGLGLTVQDGDFVDGPLTVRFDDWRLAYQGIIGLNVAQTKNAELYCEYRYLGNTDSGAEFDGVRVEEFSYLSESVVLGLRFKR
ncbi:MAG: outer membrane beta-barrel protein [Mariniblastus sp.]|nr:outer membrane beta-barrel protein [Mariniblastus sp.]